VGNGEGFDKKIKSESCVIPLFRGTILKVQITLISSFQILI